MQMTVIRLEDGGYNVAPVLAGPGVLLTASDAWFRMYRIEICARAMWNVSKYLEETVIPEKVRVEVTIMVIDGEHLKIK